MAEQTALQAPANGVADKSIDGQIVTDNSLQLQVDVDNLSVDGFIELLELQESMEVDVKASHVANMYRLLAPCVTNMDVGKLPYRHLQQIMETVIAELSAGGTASGN